MTSFDLRGKVAIVTGGASGIGFQYALKLLEKGVRGVTLADIATEVGDNAVQEIERKYGKHRAIFVKTDVTNYDQFEEAFKKTVDTFKNVDILINNAGIMNDAIWQKEISINVNGTIHGVLLGLENYIPKYKSGSEGVILNISSVVGVMPSELLPIYTGTKFAVHGMTLSWGGPNHYKRTNVKVIGVCPGVTLTPLILDMANRNLGPNYEKLRDWVADLPTQTAEQIAPNVIKIIEKAPSGTIWIAEGGEEPYQFVLPERTEIPKINL